MLNEQQERAKEDERVNQLGLELLDKLQRVTVRLIDLRAGVQLHVHAKQFAIVHDTDPLRRDCEQLRQIADSLHAAANWIDPPRNLPHTFAGSDRCPRCKRIHANDLVPENGPDLSGGVM
jgi:hypothetical protein